MTRSRVTVLSSDATGRAARDYAPASNAGRASFDGDPHWCSISKDNILTVSGSAAESRIADPANPNHVCSWLICQGSDDKGKASVYEDVAENGDRVALAQTNERNRVRSANRTLKDIRYGNSQPLLIDPTQPRFRQTPVLAPDFSSAGWMFEVVFDSGEPHAWH